MASNKELTDQANALASDLGIEAKTDGLNNQALQALVADLTKRAEDATKPGQTPPAPPAAPREPPAGHTPFDGAGENALGGAPQQKRETPPLRFEFQVAARRSVTSLKGILGEGSEARPEFFHRDQKTAQGIFENLVTKGIIVESKRRGAARNSRG